MLKDDSLYNYFKNNSRANIKTYDNLDDLVKNAGSRIIVVDNEIYSYYQNNKFKKLKLLYKDNMMNDYKFMVKSDDEAFYKGVRRMLTEPGLLKHYAEQAKIRGRYFKREKLAEDTEAFFERELQKKRGK